MKTSAPNHHCSLVVSALGVVFGDIGTSPLYAFQTALNASPETGPEASFGVASLIVWSLLAIVTGKYVLLVMRADYKGEGGILALLALLENKHCLEAKDQYAGSSRDHRDAARFSGNQASKIG